MLRYLTLIAHLKKKNIKGASISLIKIKSQGETVASYFHTYLLLISNNYMF